MHRIPLGRRNQPGDDEPVRWRPVIALLAGIVCLALPMMTGNDEAGARVLGRATIPVHGPSLDLDTRPDLPGVQNTLTAVKDFPTAVLPVLGTPGAPPPVSLPPGAVVKADLTGPALGDEVLTLVAAPNELMEVPALAVSGDYALFNVRLEDSAGNVLLVRERTSAPLVITVIEKLLVTQVNSRALTLDEIREKGIVIDEDNFTAVNFTVGLTLGSEEVAIDLPVIVPRTTQAAATIEPPRMVAPATLQRAFDRINIPNFSLAGFQLQVPPQVQEEAGIELPPINGVIVIPGNIGFLNQFFSVILQATNVAPGGSGLTLRSAKATVALPAGGDDILGSGDDPLRVAETREGGVQEVLPLLGPGGDDEIRPQATHQAEFLVEGLREGTHQLHFDITGDLYVPSLDKTLPMTGKAAGLVQVKNPTFSIVLAHPDVVREGEAYSMFATVTNTSSKPANLFRLALSGRSLSGARLAEDETSEKTLEQLAPGQAETLEFRMVARTTGEVTGTVFLADPSINGSFVLTTGVGDTGIPLSPDTLVLPDTVDYLPDEPDLVFQAVRLLGQAYSVATAPAGALPPDIARISKSYVFDRAVRLAQAGLHVRFGETGPAAARDILMDYLGSGPRAPPPPVPPPAPDVSAVSSDPALQRAVAEATAAQREAAEAEIDAANAERDRRAFDALRRAADAGHDFTDVVAQLVGAGLEEAGLVAVQGDWASAYASREPHLSFAAQSEGAPLHLRLTAGEDAVLGRVSSDEEMARGIAFADRLTLIEEEGRHAQMLLAAVPGGDAHVFEWTVEGPAGLELAMVLPAGADSMVQVTYPRLDVEGPASGRMTWQPGADSEYRFEVDSDGDGAADRVIEPAAVTPVPDLPPRVVGVQQWAKGTQPSIAPSFEYGDPLGRMVGVFFSEEVSTESAREAANYGVAANKVLQVALQPDQRLAFLILDKPVGPFVERALEVADVVDLRENAMAPQRTVIGAASERGVGGRYSGQVLTAAGEPVPFASVKYIQPVSKPSMFGGCLGSEDVEDYVISTYEADADGRFSVDYVLQSGFPTPDCPSNADVWLNETNPGSTVNFKLEALDPETGEIGKASSRIHFDGQRLAFDVIIRGYGAIEGKVVREDGQPVEAGPPNGTDALYVYASNISTGERYRTWVDEAGAYAFPRKLELTEDEVLEAPKVTVGNVILNVIRPSDGHTAVTTVNLPAAGTTTTQDLMMMPPNRFGRVSGRVLEADGERGAANVLVQIAGRVLTGVSIYERTYGHGVVGATNTDANGQFEFDNVPTGDIEVRAFRQETYEQAAAKSLLEPNAEQTVTLLFPGTGGTVRGLVRDAFGQPVPHAKVAGGPTMTEADEKGLFVIERLPLGRHRIYAQAPDAPALGQVDVQSIGPGDVQTVVVTLEPTGSVVGTVYRADGETPAVGQKVQLWVEPDRGVMAEATADADGRFAFEGYPVGEYSVRAVAADRGDGGMAFTAIRFAGDSRDADIVFRGLGSIAGRVVQSNGTPALTDVIVRRKVWRIVKDEGTELQQAYRDVIETVKEQSDERTAKQIDKMMQETGAAASGAEFFMLVDESKLLKSDVAGPGGEVTGGFRIDRVLAGPFTVAAFGPFLAPAEVSGEIPSRVPAPARAVDVGDVVLTPATGVVRGTVFLPDGNTPVGAGVVVRLRSLDSSGSVMTARGAVEQPVLPEIDVETDESGRFEFPLVLRGRVVLSADTGVPDTAVAARAGAEIDANRFADDAGKRVLNVRLYAQGGGVVPAGETLDVDLRLANAASVKVKVVDADGRTPVPQAEISLRTASTLDADEEEGFARLTTDANGEIELYPVIEGDFSIGARLPGSPARGRAAGSVPDRSAAGHQVSVTVQLGAVTTAAGDVIPAAAFGSVEGVVLRADGAPLDNPAQVTVTAGGLRILATTIEGGRFVVPDVPVGAVVVEAFEPFTARRGRVDTGLAKDGDVAKVQLPLVGLGTVTGTILSSDGETPLSRVDVLLFPSGRFSDKLVTRSDPRGRYRLPGVPVGPYTVRIRDTETGLVGETRGLMRRDGQELTTNVRFEPSGRIVGRIYAAGVSLDEEGQPIDSAGEPLADAPVVAGAPITLRGPRGVRTVQSKADGSFDSGLHLPLGRYRLAIRQPDGKDGADAIVDLTYDGETASRALALAGSGTVEGIVLDSLGEQPVATAEVKLISRSRFQSGETSRFTEADGSFRFENVPVGRFSLSVRRTVGETELGATVDGEIARHGEVVVLREDEEAETFALRLQASGSVLGQVLMSDGETPAEGVIVVLQGGGLSLGRQSTAEGGFRFDGLPLGDYRLSLREPEINAVAQRRVTVAENGQALDLGRIVLDGEAPRLVATTPGADDAGVAPTAPITLTFSEPVDPATVNAKTVRVFLGTTAVPGKVSVESDGLAATFLPSEPWPDLRLVRLEVKADRLDPNGKVVEAGIRDLAGRSLPRDHLLTFTTADATPPTLLVASPAEDATGIPPRSVVRLEFSEPIDLATVGGVKLLVDGAPVDGQRNAQPIMGGRVLVFTPREPLRPDTLHEVLVTGPVRDSAGNAMPAPSVKYAFRTLDTRPPQITALGLPEGITPTEGRTVPLTPDFADPDDVSAVEYYVAGELVGVVGEAPFAHRLRLEGEVGATFMARAVAIDAAGNRSQPLSTTLTLVANQPPRVEIVPPTDGQVGAGETVRIVVRGADDVGLAQASLTANDGALARLAAGLDGAEQVEHVFALPIPPNLAAGEIVTLQASVEDTLGLVTPATPVRLSVIDRFPPLVRVVEPAHDSGVNPGDEIKVRVQAEDASGISDVSLFVTGATTLEEQRQVETDDTAAEAVFTVKVPDDATAHQSLALTARATDGKGNRGTRDIQLKINDLLPPKVAIEMASGLPAAEPGRRTVLHVKATDEIGVVGVQLQIEGVTEQKRRVDSATETRPRFEFALPKDLPLGETLTMTATARDRDGNEGVATLALESRDLFGPGVKIAAPADPKPGAEFEVKVVASDRYAVAAITLSAEGAAVAQLTHEIEEAAPKTEATFKITVPAEAKSRAGIKLIARARDAAGNEGRPADKWVYVADVIPPTVSEIAPADGTGDVAVEARVTASFSEAISPKSVTPESFVLHGPDGPVAGKYRFSRDRRRVTLVPSQPLAHESEHRLELTTAVTDAFGNGLAAPVTSRFKTLRADTTGPAVAVFEPGEDAVGVPMETVLRVSFGEPLLRNTVRREAIRLLDWRGNAVPVRYRLAQDQMGLDVTPRARLVSGVTYTLVLDATITDEAGNGITGRDGNPVEQVELRFTTAALTVAQPSLETGVQEHADVRLEVAEGPGLKVDAVAVEVLGRRLPLTTKRPFRARFLAPSATAGPDVAITLIGLDAEGEEIARNIVRMPVNVGLRGPSLVGVAAGGNGRLDLRVSSPLAEDLEIELTSSAPETVRIDQAKAVLRAGDRHVAIPLRGGAVGRSMVTAESVRGRVSAIVAVSEPVSDMEVVGTGPSATVSVRPTRVAGSVWIPAPGDYRVSVPFVDAPVQGAAEVSLISTAPDVVSVAETASMAVGDSVVSLSLAAKAPGLAKLTLSSSEGRVVVLVAVGDVAPRELGAAASQPAGVVVRPVPTLPLLFLAAVGDIEARARVLATPAETPTEYSIANETPDVVQAPETLVVPAGEVEAPVALKGLRPGRGSLRLIGDGRELALPIVVGPDDGGIGATLLAPALAVVRRAPFDGALHVPRPGTYRVAISMLSSPAAADRDVALASDASTVVVVPETGSIKSGGRMVFFDLEVLSAGEATLTLRSAGKLLQIPVRVGGDAELPAAGIVTQSAGVSVAVSPTVGSVLFAEPGQATVRLPLPAAAANALPVEPVSDAPSVAEAKGPVQLANGMAELTIVAHRDGRSRLRLPFGEAHYIVHVAVGEAAVLQAAASATAVPLTLLQPAGSLGLVALAPGGRQTVSLPLGAAPGDIAVASRNPELLRASGKAVGSGRDARLEMLLQASDAAGVAVVDVAAGTLRGTLKVFVGDAEEAGNLAVWAPPVGVEIEE